MILNRALSNLQPSQTLALNQKAKAMQAQGRKVYNFTAGEPDGNTPSNIIEAAIKSMQEGKTRYTDTAGVVELRKAIIEKVKRVYDKSYELDEVVVSVGGKQAIFNALYAMLNPEDEVMLLSPSWVSYKSVVGMLGASVVEVKSSIDQGFTPSIDDIKAKLTSNTRVLILNSPCNPSGAVYSKEFFDDLAMLLESHPQVLVMSDDIYEHFVFEGEFVSIAHHPKISKERLLLVSGVSKSHAMTGWRIGYALGPVELIKAMKKIQSQVTSNACSVAQYAALEAVLSEEKVVNPFVASFRQRRDCIFGLLSEIEGLKVILPKGAFYIFPNIEAYIGATWEKGTIDSDVSLCSYLLEEFGVAVVPGSAFSAPGHLRMSYGLDLDEIKQGVALLAQGLNKLVKS